jgi:hypothetical protein
LIFHTARIRKSAGGRLPNASSESFSLPQPARDFHIETL